jgi:hypothetical protein
MARTKLPKPEPSAPAPLEGFIWRGGLRHFQTLWRRASSGDPEECRKTLALWRRARFFGDGGLHDRFARQGDRLVQFGEIVSYLGTTAGLDRDAVIARFRFSIQNNGFGRHGSRQTIEHLIDLDCVEAFPPGEYSLRPSWWRAEEFPELLRARSSFWAGWLATQGLPVPPEFKTAMPSDIEPLPYPKRRGGRPPKFEWDLFWCEVVRVADTPDGLPERIKLHKHMLEYCSKKWGDDAPADSTIREKLAKLK